MPNYRHCHECGDLFAPSRPHHRLCWECWRLQDRADGRDAGSWSRSPAEKLIPVLDARTLRTAIALCHPDRHEGRVEQATRTTQVLTAALARVRELEACL